MDLSDTELEEMLARDKAWEEEERIRKYEYGVQRRAKYQDKIREQKKEWNKNNPENVKLSSRKKGLKRKYGLTLEEYDEMLEKQDGCCAICKSDDPASRWGRFHVDHDKYTGKIRGLLCHPCNFTIGNHSADYLHACADYVANGGVNGT